MNFAYVLKLVETFPSIPLAIAIIILLFYVVYLHTKISRFTRGESGASLETLIKRCVDSVALIEEKNELISEHALSLDSRVSQSIRNAQTIRYKAFEANGSNQSFSIALLNEKGNGVVLSTLHARDRISTFAKPIEKYLSTHDLTEEEQSVIEESKKAHKR
ncbi:MAG: DUF4446 family protein [Candidatus Nomurabacteria bacterium]|nr:DUF4446 family protein [Candidatus Nomurabacteria bacterium]